MHKNNIPPWSHYCLSATNLIVTPSTNIRSIKCRNHKWQMARINNQVMENLMVKFFGYAKFSFEMLQVAFWTASVCFEPYLFDFEWCGSISLCRRRWWHSKSKCWKVTAENNFRKWIATLSLNWIRILQALLSFRVDSADLLKLPIIFKHSWVR